ncbi:MAG: helix-turn-helix domain-containing protein [Prevotellaceae bacterium]|jgi:AraC-like DNA-binding protein|nr:helix-turn-helix domain-containing protein [Prevotellaceae bacterium]
MESKFKLSVKSDRVCGRMWICCLTVFVLLCGQLSSAFAQSPDDNDGGRQHKIDSLRALLPAANMEEKREIYKKMEVLYIFFNDLDKQLAFLNEYIEYAREMQDVKLESFIMAQKALTYHNLKHWEEYLPLMPADMEFWSKHEMWRFYFIISHIKIAYLILNHHYETAIKEAEKMYTFAKEDNIPFGKGIAQMSMGSAYYALDRYEDSRKCFREAINIFCTVKEYHVLDFMSEAFRILCKSILHIGEYTAALPVLNEWESQIKDFEQKNPETGIPTCKIQYYVMSAEVYVRLGEFQRAEESLHKIDRTVSESYAGAVMINKCRVQLYIRQGMYDRAMQLIELIMPYFKPWDDVVTVELMQAQAEIADSTDNSALGHSIYRQLYHHFDSLNRVKMAAQLDELHTIYEVDKLTLENDRLVMEKDYHRKYMLLYFTGCCLLFVALGIWIVYSRRLDVKNRILVARILEQDKLMNTLQSALIARRKSESESKQECDNDLLNALNQLMTETGIFSNPGLNRKILAELLNISEQRLQKLIYKHFSCSVVEYISDQRLKFARDLLSNHSEKYTVEAIAIESGFGNRRTFYRQFQQRYGVTPGAYRTYSVGQV